MIVGVIPSLGRECLGAAMASLLPQVDRLLLVKTSFYAHPFANDGRVVAVHDMEQPKNISRWWNRGLSVAARWAELHGEDTWSVLVANDDIVAPPHLVRTLEGAMRAGTDVLAWPSQPDRGCDKIAGFCFMVRGESGLRADESLVWWYGDDDLLLQAREQGGAVCVPDCSVDHRHPSELTFESAELSAQTHRDRETFLAKWRNR